MSRKSWRLGAATLGLVVVAVVAAFVASGSSGGGRDGPLVEPPHAGNTAFGMPDDVGSAVSISGPFVVENSSDNPLVLDSVTLVGSQAGIALQGAYVIHLPGHAYIGSAYGYRVPPDGDPLHGATIAAHSSIAVIFGITATKPGRHTWSAIQINYEEGQSRYVGRYGLSGRICAPKAKYWRKNGCPTPPLTPPVTS